MHLNCSRFYHQTLASTCKYNITLLGGGPLQRRMNAIKVHSGHNNSNSINFRGATSGTRGSIRADTGTETCDLVYPPGTNQKMGKITNL